jgi:hypothetical protein
MLGCIPIFLYRGDSFIISILRAEQSAEWAGTLLL